ncbi:hypothetical protein SAMN05428970_3746 [Agromyces sp. CF514]|uniref:DUF6325 family protein n=1 Tax=Agromyces sp. CF514 TaxID=1881031 RepID=UPI0008EF5F07|nr:DUF6325 family protein [Agromyces sp. CF514]SFR91038.1 hypothetical protein SAMN05428970_3746 [Agromyces sp. CF514]
MAEYELEDLGPVDYLVIEFPAGHQTFAGEIAAELAKLVDAGTIRLVDAVVLAKGDDGVVAAVELADAGDLSPLVQLEADLAELLAADEVIQLADSMTPGSVAAVIVYENVWAGPFAASVRRAGGQLVATGRIPIQAIIASIEADASAAEADA